MLKQGYSSYTVSKAFEPMTVLRIVKPFKIALACRMTFGKRSDRRLIGLRRPGAPIRFTLIRSRFEHFIPPVIAL